MEMDSSLQNFLAVQSHLVFASNSWLIALFSPTEPVNYQDFIAQKLEPLAIRVNSKTYSLVISGRLEKSAIVVLYESYRITNHSKILSNKLGTFSNGKMHFGKEVYIWERRRDLQGLQFTISVVESPPFIYLNEDKVVVGRVLRLR